MGTLEVELIDARGLKDTDFFSKIDPYVIVQYRSQERKTKVAKDGGTTPSWNEIFRFRVQNPGGGADNQQHKLILKIMDRDTFSKDDFIGEAQVYLGQLIATGMQEGFSEIKPCKYNVVLEDKTYSGEIRVGVKFTKEKDDGNEEFGGWRHSFRA